MTDSSLDLELQIRLWAEDLADSIPAYEPVDAVQPIRRGARPGRRRRVLLVSMAAGVAMVGAAAAWRTAEVGRDELRVGSQTSGGALAPSLVADHERIDYVQEADLRCPAAAIRSGGFNRMSIETWATVDGGQVRTTVRYPDGGSRDVILMDDGPRLPKVFVRGTPRGDTLGCVVEGNGILVSEPAQSDVYSLNLAASSELIPSGEKRVPGYADLGTQVPGEYSDSSGRIRQLWRQTVSGFAEFGGGRHPIIQTTEWYVDGGTGRVMEKTYMNEIKSLGTARWRATLVGSSRTSVPATTFDTGGYQREPVQPGTPSTTSPAVPDNGKSSPTSQRSRP